MTLPNGAVARPFSRDRLMLTPRDEAMKGAMALLDRIQNEAPEIGMAAASIMFAAFCRRVRMNPQEAHQLGLRLLTPEPFHQKGNIVGEVLQDFAGLRIAGDRRMEVAPEGATIRGT